MKILTVLPMLFLLMFSHPGMANAPSDPGFESEPDAAAQQEEVERWVREFHNSLDFQTGDIQLPNGVSTLHVPENFYYLSPEDTERVLVEAWGNPPGNETLGMLFPAEYSPLDPEVWGVTIEYEEDGYVSDEDANDIDYDDLLGQMQADTRDESSQRVEAGYPSIDLIGWAARPHYDAGTHKLYWAKELQFGDAPQHTLNYNIRALGRQGVLVLNFIADMDQLPQIEQNLDTVLNMAEFDQGHRYSEFDPDVDQVAAYGLGALVAGKVAMKTGFLAAALLFLKKFGVFILVGIAAVGRKLFGKKKSV